MGASRVVGSWIAAALSAALALGGPAPAQARVVATTDVGRGVYLVTLTARPAASYAGGLAGLPATRPAPGRRFDRTDPAVLDYAAHLRAGQDAVLAAVGNPTVLYRYTTVADGFAAVLDTAQVKALRARDDVALVERSTRQRVQTTDSPATLGLDGPGGAWARHGGPERAGRGTVIGMVDTGIWPENPSFAGLPQQRPGESRRLPGFHGACQVGAHWRTDDCNAKVVSARWFVSAFGTGGLARSEYLSPRDGSGHGSQTASVAAGNHGVTVTVDGQRFGRASGAAPGARLAVYKACWTAPDPSDDGCETADTVAAVDRAVADGVDVLSYPVSGAPDTADDTVERALLNAAAAGVFVAAAAGNGGAGPVSHPSPWVTTVAASTHQAFQGAVRLGNGREYVGAMVHDAPVPAARIVLGADVGLPRAGRRAARLCEPGALDAELTEGNIVVCDRGSIARVDKSTAVARAGGAAMVLVNTRPDTVDADVHAVPTVHLDRRAGLAVKAYVRAQGAEATAALDPAAAAPPRAPGVAGFSSRRPGAAGVGNLLKPDLAAPGVAVVAGTAPPTDAGRLWDLASGTSLSAAHVAGLAAFALDVHPDWTPARVRSALVTTASPMAGGPLSRGAGLADGARFLDPGLVLDAGPVGWTRFLAGHQVNEPSVAVASLTGPVRVTRRVTSVSRRTETYTVRLRGLTGVAATVRPRSLTLAPGQTGHLHLRLRPTAALTAATAVRGGLTLTSARHTARLPVVVTPALVDAPASADGTGSSGAVVLRGRTGVTGALPLSVAGPVAASPVGLSLVPGPMGPAFPVEDADTSVTTTDVPAGTAVARFTVDGNRAADDLDLFVYRGDRLVGRGTGPEASETVTLVDPRPGRYRVVVHSVAAANGSTTTGRLFTWVVPDRDTGRFHAPPSLAGGPGTAFAARVSWRGLDLTQRWFGAVRYGAGADLTLLSVD